MTKIYTPLITVDNGEVEGDIDGALRFVGTLYESSLTTLSKHHAGTFILRSNTISFVASNGQKIIELVPTQTKKVSIYPSCITMKTVQGKGYMFMPKDALLAQSAVGEYPEWVTPNDLNNFYGFDKWEKDLKQAGFVTTYKKMVSTKTLWMNVLITSVIITVVVIGTLLYAYIKGV